MVKFQKIVIVALLLSFSNNLLPAAAARQAVTKMAAGVGVTVAGMKAAQVHQRQQAVKRQEKHLELRDAFQEEDWQKFRWYPHAAGKIKDILQKKGRSPKEFGFLFVGFYEGWLFDHHEQIFHINEHDIKELNITLRDQSLDTKRYYSFRDGMKTNQDHANLVCGIFGHEAVHAISSERVVNTIKKLEGNFFQRLLRWNSQKINDFIKEHEKEADLNASDNPAELRALAQYVAHKFLEDDEHPHPLERVRYLREKADELEAQQKLAEKKLQQEQENYLMLSN